MNEKTESKNIEIKIQTEKGMEAITNLSIAIKRVAEALSSSPTGIHSGLFFQCGRG